MRQVSGHTARRRFGQNFLVAPGVIRGIVDAIAPRRDDRMVEIGPGLGALTEPLLACLDHLHVVEIDRDLIARLRRRFPADRLSIHEGDALAFDFGSLGAPLRIVGNLPYNISTPLLFHLAGFAERIGDMHFMLQKEVVDRMAAAPGSGDFGRLSVMLQYRFHVECLFPVPPEAFDPAPKVDSAIVRLIPRAAAERTARDEEVLARVVAAAFSQRRKMLRNTLREMIPADGLTALGIAPTARAEDLAVADFVALANSLS
ncbi:MAG: 16S rRNA (adenine(1518)-N(6)/adenine(1519)-N(6))-dimethyltransferase RsmA [Sterolibacteriaceae bacterium MAG5]|nr:16S rRNA (adenine(1518)-N(6)/adenine(1519)-N(6))-dimethyltransferase RsmA [Candidatus Nitricoxidireducens bremensis]